jgi:hypothetical protein
VPLSKPAPESESPAGQEPDAVLQVWPPAPPDAFSCWL